MRKVLTISASVALALTLSLPVFAQSAPTPGQTNNVTVTPNQQTTQASAVSNPTGTAVSQQNNFYDPGVNAFGPGIQCSGPYIASSMYRNDQTTPGSFGGITGTGGTLGLVVPLNGSSKKCQEFVHEILFQKQLDTCLSMAKQGFEFDPTGQYAELAKRCTGIRYNGHPITSAGQVSPVPGPTVITVPAGPTPPQSNPTIPHAEVDVPAPAPAVVQVAQHPSAVVTQHAVMSMKSYCQQITVARKRSLIATIKKHDSHRGDALAILRAACIPDSEIVAVL